ncbi:AtuA-related protein [Fusicatenibacter sp.]
MKRLPERVWKTIFRNQQRVTKSRKGNRMKLKEIAHARTGDKGEISNISVIPYDENDYEMLKEKVTEARVAEYFHEICHGKVTRYELDGIHALNFVLDKTLGGGVTRSLALDKHGKTLGMALLEMEV